MKAYSNLLVALFLATLPFATLDAASPAEMLEKGIYNEDTVGNLDEAIKIYRKVVAAAVETESIAARAQYRLGQCLLKQGDKAGAIDAFKLIAKNFPNQKEIIAKAKAHLPDELQLQRAPWRDGEHLTMTMKLAGGRVIGLIGLGVNSVDYKGQDVWHMTIRRFLDSGNNEGVSQVWVDKSNNRPLQTKFNHVILGTADATWTESQLSLTQRINGKAKKNDIKLDGVSYSNDQVFFGFRQLPLKVGYEASIPIRVTFTGGDEIDLEVSVPKLETIETDLGDFECFRIETNINQTFWVSNTEERYVVRFEAGGVTADLTSIKHGPDPTHVEHDELGISVDVPSDWYHIQIPSRKPNEGGFQLVAPSMAASMVYVKPKSQLKDEDRESLDTYMDSKTKRMKSAYKGFTPRPRKDGSEVTLLGFPARHVIADHKAGKRNYAISLAVALGDKHAVQLTAHASKKQFELNEKQFDAIRKSLKLR